VANRKGGTGKTTLAVAVAQRLAERERVLLVDLDSQANATEWLGVQAQPGVFLGLGGGQEPEVVRCGDRLELVPGNGSTERVSLILAAEGT